MKSNTSVLLQASARIAASTNGPPIDIQSYTDWAIVVLNASATEGAGQTATFKIQHSSDSVAWADTAHTFQVVTNAAPVFLQRHVQINDLRRYIRVVSTLSAGAAITIGAQIFVKKRWP